MSQDDIENNDEIRALRRNIEETRQRISGEVGELSERLTPEHAKHVAKEKLVEAKDRAIERTSQGARHMGHVVRDNPIPTAMIAAGTGWLLWETFRPRSGPMYERIEGAKWQARQRLEHGREQAGTRGAEYRDRARAAYSSAAETARSKAMSAKAKGGELYDRGRYGAQRAYVRTQDTYDTNPIVFGVAALVAGVGIGMLLPHTEREDRAMGERRQQLVNRARHMAEEAKDVAVESAKEGARAARERARTEARNRPDLPNPR